MKKLLLFLAVAAMAVPVSAQGFLGKLKKGVDKVLNANQALQGNPSMNWRNYFDLDVVSCEGDPATGQVVITLAATRKAAKSLELGSQENRAGDALGNSYSFKPLNSKSTGSKELVAGIPRRYQMLVEGVTPGLPLFSTMNLNFYAWGDSNCGSNMADVDPILIKNVPIVWTPLPEVNIVAMPAELKEVCGMEVVSCVGNQADGTAKLTLAVTTESPKANLSLNNGKPIEIYDLTGRAYQNVPSDTNYTGRQLNNGLPNLWEFTISGLSPEMSLIPMAKIDFYANDYANDLNVGSNMISVEPILIKNIAIDWQ